MVTPKYLLDTNQVSRFLDGEPDIVKRVAQHQWDELALPVAVCAELFYMARHSARVNQNMDRLTGFLGKMRIIDANIDTAFHFGEIKHDFIAVFGPKPRVERTKIKMEHLGLSNNDLWIAATAVQHRLVLVTSDRHFERVQQVRHFDIETWWSPGTGGNTAGTGGGEG